MTRWVALVVWGVACNASPSPAASTVTPLTSVVASASASASASATTIASTAASAHTPTSANPIDRLVAKLTASPMWENGGFSRIDLPETAPVRTVLDRVFAAISFDRGKVTRHDIVETRKVRIDNAPPDYIACLVDTNLGREVVLLRWMDAKVGWWSRVFTPTDF